MPADIDVKDYSDSRAAFFIPRFNEPDMSPQDIANRLVDEVPRFSHLKEGEAVIMFVMCDFKVNKKGRRVLGQISLPQFQGSMSKLCSWLLAMACEGHWPDYIMVLESEFWGNAQPKQREALVFHELCHTEHSVGKDGELKFKDDGRPVFGIQGHDIEEFNAVVERYGAWLPDIKLFAAALRDGGAA